MRCLALALLIGVAGAGEVQSQGLAAGVESSLETGWTSNASDSPLGGDDLYVRHEHAITISGQGENFALCGTLAFSEMRFASLTYEDDTTLGDDIEAELALAPTVTLRLGYGGERSWTGDELDLGGGLLAEVRTEETRHEWGAEVTASLGTQALSLGFARASLRPGQTSFGDILPSLRLSPEADLTTLRAAWEGAIADDAALTAEAAMRIGAVPEADQFLYARLPANGARVSAGLRAGIGAAFNAFAAAGFDVVWPQVRPDLMAIAPYVDAAFEIALTSATALSIEAGLGTELLDPIDGVASRTAQLGIGLVQAITPELALFAELAVEREAGIYDPGARSRRQSIGAGMRYGDPDGLLSTLALTRAHTTDASGSYAETRLSLQLSGRL